MFSAEFYPTPRSVARRMFGKISNKEAKYFLEPSAGKGDICDVIRRPYTDDEFEEEFPSKDSDQRERRRYAHYRQEDRRVDIDVIEAHPDLVSVLRHKALTVVGYDWLTYDGVSYYDAIVHADKKILDWLQEEDVDTIYFDDGRIIDVKSGNLRAAITAAMKKAGAK